MEILEGKDAGKQGKVVQVIRQRNWVVVEGLNTVSAEWCGGHWETCAIWTLSEQGGSRLAEGTVGQQNLLSSNKVGC